MSHCNDVMNIQLLPYYMSLLDAISRSAWPNAVIEIVKNIRQIWPPSLIGTVLEFKKWIFLLYQSAVYKG